MLWTKKNKDDDPLKGEHHVLTGQAVLFGFNEEKPWAGENQSLVSYHAFWITKNLRCFKYDIDLQCGPPVKSKSRSVGVHITPISLWFIICKYNHSIHFFGESKQRSHHCGGPWNVAMAWFLDHCENLNWESFIYDIWLISWWYMVIWCTV